MQPTSDGNSVFEAEPRQTNGMPLAAIRAGIPQRTMSESADVRSMANGRLTFIAAHYTKSPRPRRSLQSKQIPPQQDLVRTIISFSRAALSPGIFAY